MLKLTNEIPVLTQPTVVEVAYLDTARVTRRICVILSHVDFEGSLLTRLCTASGR